MLVIKDQTGGLDTREHSVVSGGVAGEGMLAERTRTYAEDR